MTTIAVPSTFNSKFRLLILVTIFAPIVKADGWRRSTIDAAHHACALGSSLPAGFML
jgi:hypothetical protein